MREVLDIIQGEGQSLETSHLGRLMQRVQGAFNAQQSAHGFVPGEPGILTPSTNNTSNTSGDRSDLATTREICQITPSLMRTSRQLATAAGPSDTLQVSYSDELDEQSNAATTRDGAPMVPYISHFPETNDVPAFEQPDDFAPVPFRGFTAPTPPFDFDQHEIRHGYSDFRDFNFAREDLDGTLDLRGSYGASEERFQ
jgi:hypothetical protein